MASLASSLIIRILFLLISVQDGCAQDCWRDTTCSNVLTPSFSGPWNSNVLAPHSRTVSPSVLLDTSSLKQIDTWPGHAALGPDQPSVVFDFGQEVGGIASIGFTVHDTGSGAFGLAFSEAKNFIGPNSDSSNGIDGTDGAIYANFTQPGDYTYVMPDEELRGGFRYMTLFVPDGSAQVSIYNISLEISFQPTWPNLQAYGGYFHSNDDLLNRIWYSGAYTLQTDAVLPSTGRAWPAPANGGWENNGELGPGNTILTDGAKRDRTVWPGDLGVAVPAAFYSTGDLESAKNGLQTLYDHQNPTTGELPFSGPPLLATGSDTYHLWTMIGTYNYVFYTNDLDFLNLNWAKYKLGMTYAFNQFDNSSGLYRSNSNTNDWGRLNSGGTITEIQAIFYRTLTTGANLADWAGDTSGLKEQWLEEAEKIQTLTKQQCWDSSVGAFADAPNRTSVHPQDGNTLAVLFGIVNATSSEAASISDYLITNWTPIGAECQELPGEISPFISSFEIQAHLLSGQAQRALDLIRRSWGWYLNNPNGTQSTMIEGYLVNGTFGYRWDAGYDNDFSYTSHSHGWSTGPVTALTNFILGLSVTGPAGSTWRLAPQAGDLDSVEGGFTTTLGKFSASWTRESDGSLQLNYNTPSGTSGEVILPVSSSSKRSVTVVVDGKASKRSLRKLVVGVGGQRVIQLPGLSGEHSIRVG